MVFATIGRDYAVFLTSARLIGRYGEASKAQRGLCGTAAAHAYLGVGDWSDGLLIFVAAGGEYMINRTRADWCSNVEADPGGVRRNIFAGFMKSDRRMHVGASITSLWWVMLNIDLFYAVMTSRGAKPNIAISSSVVRLLSAMWSGAIGWIAAWARSGNAEGSRRIGHRAAQRRNEQKPD